METASESADALRKQITAAEEELQRLKSRLADLERLNADTKRLGNETANEHQRWPLSPAEYKRYGRQMIVPSIGLKGKSFKSRG